MWGTYANVTEIDPLENIMKQNKFLLQRRYTTSPDNKTIGLKISYMVDNI